MKLAVLVGGSGRHAAVLLEAASLSGLVVAGFIPIEKDVVLRGTDYPKLGGMELLENEAFLRNHRCAIGCGDNRLRQAVAEKLRAQGGLLQTIVHAQAVVSPSAEIGPGCAILAGAIVGPYARLGRGVIVNHGASVDHDCVIGDYANLCPGARLGGTVRIGERAFLGLNACILQGRMIGNDAIVGAGAVATKDVMPHVTVVGVPARPR